MKSCGSLDDQGRAGRGAGRGRQGRYGRRSWKGKAEHWEVEHCERARLEYQVITFFFFFFVCRVYYVFFFFILLFINVVLTWKIVGIA